jgi:hypothetical protein
MLIKSGKQWISFNFMISSFILKARVYFTLFNPYVNNILLFSPLFMTAVPPYK